jgi:hypothetical protein
MKWFVGIALALSLIGTSAQAQSTDITADIQAAANDWMNAYNNKDAAKIAQCELDSLRARCDC